MSSATRSYTYCDQRHDFFQRSIENRKGLFLHFKDHIFFQKHLSADKPHHNKYNSCAGNFTSFDMHSQSVGQFCDEIEEYLDYIRHAIAGANYRGRCTKTGTSKVNENYNQQLWNSIGETCDNYHINCSLDYKGFIHLTFDDCIAFEYETMFHKKSQNDLDKEIGKLFAA